MGACLVDGAAEPPGEGPHGAQAVARLRDQLPDRRCAAPDSRVRCTFTRDKRVALAGDEQCSLREPTIRITDLGYGALEGKLDVGTRRACAVGVGLLDAVPD